MARARARYLAIGLMLAAGGAAAGAQQGGTEDAPVFMTGAEPVSPEEYSALPKLTRHRAWLPKTVDLSPTFPKPGTQGAQPNCAAWASTYAARSYLYGRDIGRRPDTPAELMSPAYVYNRLRAPGTTCWGGLKLTDALDFLKKEGVVSLADFPDDITKCKIPAPVELQQKAGALRIADWRAVDREVANDWRSPLVLDDVKGSLARGVPVIFAMPVTPQFMAMKGDAVYSHELRDSRNWHAMALVGYDEDKQAFRLINSWGPRWGDGGYAWVSYNTFKTLAGEAYTLEAPRPAVAAAAAPVESPQQRFERLRSTLPCGGVSIREDGGRRVVEGFGGQPDTIADLKAAALAADAKTEWRVAHHPWPQCEAQVTLSRQLRAGGVSIAAQTEDGKLRTGDPVLMHAGDRFGVVAEASAARPHLSIIYLQADGSAVELYRGQPAPDAKGRRAVSIGTGGPKATRFEVAAPYGDEVLIAIASAEPLFGPELRTYATERQFLTALRRNLVSMPHDSVGASVLRLRTSG